MNSSTNHSAVPGRDFRYEAVNTNGLAVRGSIRARDEVDAMQLLRSQSLTPTSLYSGAEVTSVRRVGGRVSATDRILLIRELATLLRAGIPLVDAVRSLAVARESHALGAPLMQAWRSLNGGESFVAALQAAKIALPSYVHQLAATGEMTGKLAATMADAAKQMEYDEKVRQEVINALIYPAILIAAGLAAVLLIFLIVVPKFANLIKGSRAADVPEISMWVIQAGIFFKAHWIFFAIGAGVALTLLVLGLRDEAGRTRWLVRLSRVPLLGAWLLQAEIGRWSTTLSTLLGNRVPILSALELSSSGLRLPHLRHQVTSVIRDVRGGSTLADAVTKHAVVDATGINLIRVGEASGELAQMVGTLGELYADAGRNRMKRFLALLEPAAILMIAVVIGFIMIAVMLAITSLNTIR